MTEFDDADVIIMIEASEAEIADTEERLYGPRTTLAVGRAYFLQREQIAEACKLLQEHQDSHGTADTHSGSSSDTEDDVAQQWRRRRDAFLASTA